MKEKFLQFFMGKMGKSVYIAAASAVVCVATVAGSTVAVHNHNQKIDTALESLEQAESITETVTESAAESVSASGEVNTQQNAITVSTRLSPLPIRRFSFPAVQPLRKVPVRLWRLD